MIKLLLNLIWYVSGAGALIFALLVVFLFMVLHFMAHTAWWLFTLPQRVLGAIWFRS